MTRKFEISENFMDVFSTIFQYGLALFLLWEKMVICVKLELLSNDMAKVKEVYLVSLMD